MRRRASPNAKNTIQSGDEKETITKFRKKIKNWFKARKKISAKGGKR